MGEPARAAFMSTFATVLNQLKSGAASRETVEAFVGEQVGEGATTTELRNQLEFFQEVSPLPSEDITALRAFMSGLEVAERTRVVGNTGGGGRPRGQVQVGDTIKDRFVLEKQIGEGGMSQVFQARDLRRVEAQSRSPEVAVKVMTVWEVDQDQAFMAMQREVQKAQTLTHQNIVRVNDFDRDGAIVFTTMELLDGQSLQQRLNLGPVPLAEAQGIVKAMGDALSYAHGQGIIHADFKPSNVFLTRDGQVKIIDFGIARGVPPEGKAEDRTIFDPRSLGALTPAYASPEMIEDKAPHPRDDIYALGCVVYEMLTGRHPYGRLMATEARERQTELQRPEGLSDGQWTALAATLQLETKRRTESVAEFLDGFAGGASAPPPAPRRSRGAPLALAVATTVLVAGAFALWKSGVFSNNPQLAQADEAGTETATPEGSAPAVATAPAGSAEAREPRVFRDCPDCPQMTVIAGGSGVLGRERDDTLAGMFEYPQRPLTVSRFALGRHEVTVAEFRAFADATGHRAAGGCHTAAQNWQLDPQRSWEDPGFNQGSQHPVTCVSWTDATAYTRWLSERTGERYRLPTEGEWAFVARAAAGPPAGEAESCRSANVADASLAIARSGLAVAPCNDGFAFTAPVDRLSAVDNKTPTDLLGNVFEWTADCWNDNHLDAPGDGTARADGDCALRVLRGGSWYSAPDVLRPTFRNRFPMAYRSNSFGFRIAKTL